MAVVMFTLLLGFAAVSNHETIASQYQVLSTTYQWRPYLPHIPSIIHAPFKKPSNTTLQLENGELDTVPPLLQKSTPNFHLVMPAESDNEGFCQTTLSGMILNYPPPTVVNLYREFESDRQVEKATLYSTWHYLNNTKYVQEEDLILIVDGETSWFQLPSDVIIQQYKKVLEYANSELLKKYGFDKNGYQKYNQSIVFGAHKHCIEDDLACRYAPPSILPDDVYNSENRFSVTSRPARYLNAKMVMGPAKDLKILYRAAIKKMRKKQNQLHTVQSVFATIFAEQQLRRDAEEKKNKPATAKIKDLFSGKGARSTIAKRLKAANMTLSNSTQYEFSIGLDYTHVLFQPLSYASREELVPVIHDNSTDLSEIHHPSSWSQYLSLPAALRATNPPFWRNDYATSNPSPNEKPAYIKNLDYDTRLDNLPKRKTSWNHVPLVQNTYTGTVPAIIQNDAVAYERANDAHFPPPANITWFNLWYSPFRRALLRNYFRTPQSPNGYHNSLVGGDRAWDTRGGRGGVWTESEQAWLPWGEVDGVCGTLTQLKDVFHDGKGVWLHELETDGETKRLEEESELNKKIQEEREKEEERLKKEAEKSKEEKEQEKKEKENVERIKAENKQKEKDRKEQEAKEQEEYALKQLANLEELERTELEAEEGLSDEEKARRAMERKKQADRAKKLIAEYEKQKEHAKETGEELELDLDLEEESGSTTRRRRRWT